MEHGVPPAARNVKGDTAARNALILEHGPVKAVEEGLIPIEKFKSLVTSVSLFKVMKNDFANLPSLKNEWHYGPTGTGKSRGVRSTYPDAFIKGNNKWWDGYNGEPVVVIEEIGPNQINAHHIKLWCDHFPFSAEIKGGSVKIRPDKIVVTSNYHPEECWSNPQDLEPILRRFQLHRYHRAL